MFRKLIELIPGTDSGLKADAVLAVHPLQLSRWLDQIWARGGIINGAWLQILAPSGGTTAAPALGDPGAVTKTRIPRGLLELLRSGVRPKPGTNPGDPVPEQEYAHPAYGTLAFGVPENPNDPPPVWEHLMYAYLVEATGIFEILGEVTRRYVVGESLPAPSVDTMVWLRSTEDLFFRDAPLFSAGGLLTSHLRPDARINRRNVYWRMFGMDLPHPPGHGIQGQPWKRGSGVSANTRFLELWNELLRQVWLGIENDRNTSGANPTDSGYVGYLCQTLSEMLQLRRKGGMLSREEFAYVTMLSWFHLTVEYDTTLVRDLSANTGVQGNPADRLAAIGNRVGIAPSRQARELFELSELVSPLLWMIELGLFNGGAQAEMLYKRNGIPNAIISQTMNRIIDLWQSGTGERVKDLAVTTRRPKMDARAPQPTRLPGALVPPTSPAPLPKNGRHPAARV